MYNNAINSEVTIFEEKAPSDSFLSHDCWDIEIVHIGIIYTTLRLSIEKPCCQGTKHLLLNEIFISMH